MSYNIKVNLSGNILEGKAGELLHRELSKTIQKSILWIDNEATDKTPVGVSGDARRGVTHKMDSPLSGRVYETGPATSYIEVVEKGRRKNKRMPPSEPIEQWLRLTDKGRDFVTSVGERYNLNPKAALRSAIFLKRRAIGKLGIRPVKMFQKTYKETKPEIISMLKQAVARFTSK